MTVATMVPRDHDAFVAYRASLKGLGASDAAAAMGISRFASSFELWARLTGRIAPEAGNKRTQRGLDLEPVAAARYTRQTGRRLTELHRTVRDPRWPHLFAHPDRRVVSDRRLAQIKTAWRDYPDGIVPVPVQAQVTVESALAHVPAVDVLVMTFEELFVHETRPDPDTAGELCDWLDAWYVRHVEGDTPPRDGSRAYGRHLDAFVREAEEQGTVDQAALMAQLRTLRRQAKAIEAGEGSVVIALKESLAGATKVVGEGWRIAWVPVKGRTTTDWRLVAQAYRRVLDETSLAAETLDAIESLHTTTGEPSRQFRPSWSSAEEEEAE